MPFDVDIDVNSETEKDIYGIRAIIIDEDIKPHPSGYYVNSNMPIDGVTGMSSIEYKEAEDIGFIKVDLLTNTAYNVFDTQEEKDLYLNMDTDWGLLEFEEFVSKLPHINSHFDIVRKTKPKSLEGLADTIAIIRPGKRRELNNYMKDKDKVRKTLYDKPANGQYYFKKAHAYAYASMLISVINYLAENYEEEIV